MLQKNLVNEIVMLVNGLTDPMFIKIKKYFYGMRRYESLYIIISLEIKLNRSIQSIFKFNILTLGAHSLVMLSIFYINFFINTFNIE